MVLPRPLYLLLAAISIATQLISACPPMCNCHNTNVTIYLICANHSLESLAYVTKYEDGKGNTNLYNVFQNSSKLLNLDFSFNKLSEIHVQDFSGLQSLSYVNLQNNSISSIQPGAFSSSPKLLYLNLAHNFLESINSAIFSELQHLKILDLHGNFISNISTKAFLHTDSLISLDLSYNLIRDLQALVFENLNKLEKLNLAFNQLVVFDSVVVKGLINLQDLDLSRNQIVTFSDVSLPNLRALELSWNNISSLEENSFAYIPEVLKLNLDGNLIENVTIPVFRHVSSLQNLSISHMPKLQYLSMKTFEGLQNLTTLELSHNPKMSFIHRDLFISLPSLIYLDLSFNNITVLKNITLPTEQISSTYLRGNSFSCDCAMEWLVNEVKKNDSKIADRHDLICKQPNSNASKFLYLIDINELYCSEVIIDNFTNSVQAKLGESVRFICQAVSYPTADITWITPRRKVLEYINDHPYTIYEQSSVMDKESQNLYEVYDGNIDSSYHSEFESREDRMIILPDGSLFIAYVLRSDAGPYKCFAKNPRNSTSVVINFTLDYQIISEVKIWSIIVGSICAGSFFLLNLIYSLASAGVRKCISQRRREQICHLIESMDQYKSDQLTRIKGNYNTQVGRIRDQYHYQLGRIREHHHHKMDRIKEGASQKVERMRENYNNQLGKLKDYSSNQLVQIREKYNNQIFRIKDYGADKFERIHEKYKLKQQHVMKLLEMMNLDNCRTVFESECVRTESMILQSDILNTDVPLHSPVDSESVSESEYVTATNSEAPSTENLYEPTQSNIPISIPGEFNSIEENVADEVHILSTKRYSGNNGSAMNTYSLNDCEQGTSNSQTGGKSVAQGSDEEHDIVVTDQTNEPVYQLDVLDPTALGTLYSSANIRESFV